MSDLSINPNFFDSLTNSVQSSSGNIGASPVFTPSYGPPDVQDKSGGGFADGILYSFTNGISTVLDGLAQSAVGYTGNAGAVIGTDRYGQPIYQYRDPRTGAVTTGATATWPGAPGTPQSYPERTPINYQTGGPYGWLSNMLGLPAPKPNNALGTIPGTTLGPLSFAPGSGATPYIVVAGLIIAGLVVMKLVHK